METNPGMTNENDHLQFAGDKAIVSLLKDENLLFSDKVTKINHYGMSQERNFLLTKKGIYNLKKKSLKRRIDLNTLRGITFSKITDEFVIHGNDVEYDYNYISSRRKKIIEIIARSYYEQNAKELKLCELEAKSLSNVVTTKKEKKKDTNFSRMPNTNIISLSAYVYGIKPETSLLKKSSTVTKSGTIYSKSGEKAVVTIDDFRPLKVIGRGTMGKVVMAEHIKSKEIYAIKSLKKDILINQEQIENTLLEKKILETVDHPFLISLQYFFQTDERLYFVLPFMKGGELFQHLKKQITFDEEKARFFAAQIALALDHLHSFGIIYRDLKPENILMDDEGYLVLTDFGMAKHIKGDEKTMTFCGSPEYLAPEIISGEGHDRAVDWWSFGILIYEMLCGIPPFYNENTNRMYELIRLAELRFPKKIKVSAEAQDIISKLLDRNPNTRFGYKGGVNEIKLHPFFASINFDLILNKKLIPPFKPTISDKYDVQNFDEEFTAEEVTQSIISDKNLELIKKNNDRFNDFSKAV